MLPVEKLHCEIGVYKFTIRQRKQEVFA